MKTYLLAFCEYPCIKIRQSAHHSSFIARHVSLLRFLTYAEAAAWTPFLMGNSSVKFHLLCFLFVSLQLTEHPSRIHAPFITNTAVLVICSI